ncbi:AEC family transporter [Rhodoferax sp.]|uniref:AEC family transporter n=1 Tax=Rhodoferax sp. TaxID=50421 RepID=UPI00374CDDDA
MNNLIVSSLLPVVLLIALGWLAGQRQWIGAGSVKDLSNLVFLLLSPALLFRAMSNVHVEQLSLKPVAAYFLAAGLIFAGTLLLHGFNRTAAVLGMANTYSNSTMIGIPLIGLAYGAPGMVTLLTLVSLHALVLLTMATVAVELAVAHEEAQNGGPRRHVALLVWQAVRNAVLHPVPVPILAGLLFAQTGWTIPAVVDTPLMLLGQAFGPLALVMVGVTLAQNRIGPHLRGALGLALVKNLLHPLLVVGIGWLLGLSGLPLTVMVVAASLPMGANVFLFAQRYQVKQELITASVAVSTLLALVTVSAVMAFVAWLYG